MRQGRVASITRGLLTTAGLCVVFSCLTIGNVWGQGSLSSSMIRQMGLTRMWQTRIDFDRSRSRMSGVYMYVSPTKVYAVFEIPYDGMILRFSERDLDAYGKQIGAAEAKVKATDKLAEIKAEIAAGGNKVPVPKLETHIVPEISIYAASESGTIQAIDGETGQTRWTISVGNPDYPTSAPGANDTYVAVINGSRLYVIKADDGTIAYQRQTASAPAAGPGVTGSFIYVPGVTGAIESFEVEKPTYPTKTFFSNGRTLLQPIATEGTAAWTTDKGVLYSANGRTPGLRFRLQLPGGCVTPPAFLYPDRLIVASDNGHLYCTNEVRGTVQWRLSTGESTSRPPFAIENTAYLMTDDGGLFAIDGTSGKEKWWISGIHGFLAGTKERLYLTDLHGNVVVIASATGANLGVIPVAGVDVRYSNMLTDRILVGNSTGTLSLFREVSRTWPLVHRWDEKADRPADAVFKPAGEGEGDPGGQPMPLGNEGLPDPFGGPAVDPFGAGGDDPPAAAPMPMPAPAPAGEDFDPFK